jgi:EmrB/QacA subfamily drug resistance transporter
MDISKDMQRAVLIMVLLNAFSTSLMLSAANVSLPTIAADLSLDAVTLTWVPMAYVMASAMFVLIFGKLADIWGRKRFFLIGTVAVIVTSIVAALSVNAAMLLSARFLQGVSAAMLYATQIALVSSVYPTRKRGKVIGRVVSAIYIGLATGPLLGGYAIDLVGWRASFLLQVPLAIVALLLGVLKVKGEWSAETKTSFDLPGAIIYALGILLFCLGISRLPEIDGLALIAAAAAAIIVFLRHARHTPHPIWDVNLFFNNRAFKLSCAASLIMYRATYGNVVLLSLYLQTLKGMSASAAGMIMMLQPITMAILSPLTGRLSDRVEPRILASLGMFITAVGLLMLAMLSSSSGFLRVALALLMTGIGFSLFSSPNVNAIMGSVAPKHYGSASAAVATTRLLGQLSSIVLVTLALTLIMGNRPISPENYPQLEQSIRLSFSIAAALCVPGILLSLVRGRIHTASNAI